MATAPFIRTANARAQRRRVSGVRWSALLDLSPAIFLLEGLL
jgi:hypothetical protein